MTPEDGNVDSTEEDFVEAEEEQNDVEEEGIML